MTSQWCSGASSGIRSLSSFLFLAWCALLFALPVYAVTLDRHIQAVPSESYNFGNACSGVCLEHTFLLRNPGLKKLEILSVTADCSCTSVLDWDPVIAPNSSGKIRVRLETQGLKGALSKSIEVKSTDPNRPVIHFQLRGTVSNLIELTAHSLSFGIISNPDKITPKTILIHDRSDATMHIQLSTSANLPFKVQLRTIIPNKQYAIEVNPGDLQPGLNRGLIYLEPGSISVGRFEIPVSAYLPDAVHIRPSRIELPPGPLANEIIKTVDIVSWKKASLGVSEIKTEIPGVKIKMTTLGNQHARLDLIFPRGLTLPNHTTYLSLATNDPDYPVFQVPISHVNPSARPPEKEPHQP